MRQFLQYWKPAVADSQFGSALNHSASEQLDRVSRGDVVWIVTVREGKLSLLGRIIVDRVTDQANAENLLGNSDLREASRHIIAREGTEQRVRSISIAHLASELRFESSSGRDRLEVVESKVAPQQLQQMRLLTPGAAALFEDAVRQYEERDARAIADATDVDGRLAEEISDEHLFVEGAIRSIRINAYERNPLARRKCMDHHGTTCVPCGFNFVTGYGRLGEGFIHVHHLRALSEIGGEYELDAVRDLCPVCPNCHAMIHRRDPPLTIDELRHILNENRRQ